MVFKGIRYARAARFCRPEMVELPASLDSALLPPAVCPQRESRLGGVMGPMLTSNPLSEDCLHVSVFTPSLEGNRPVMVFAHGGAFVTGSGEFSRYDASRLSEEGDIVVVNISYRVGCFGFLYQPERDSVNLGMQDIVCALRWVRKHISRFGGDPSRVTLCAQSAGAYAAASLICESGEELFRKAILFSAPFPLSASEKHGRKLLALMKEHAGDLDAAGIQELLSAQEKTLSQMHSSLPFCPVCLERMPHSRVMPGLREVMVCCQKDDAQPFSPHPALTGLLTWAIFRLPMYSFSRLLRRKGVKVQTRVFSWRPDNGGIGACHTLELPLIFGSWECWQPANMLAGVTREEYERRGAELRSEIASFVCGFDS